MLTLLVALSFAQGPSPADAPVQPATPPPLVLSPSAPEAAPVSEAPPNRLGRKGGFFSSPRVSAGTLVGRVGMGLVLGSIVGGGLATAFLGIGGIFSGLNNSYGALIITTPLAIIALGVGTALGSAMFGADYGRDLLDAVGVALVCALISVAAGVIAIFIFPSVVGAVIAVSAGLVFPAVATPLLVQAFKKEDAPQPTVALATF